MRRSLIPLLMSFFLVSACGLPDGNTNSNTETTPPTESTSSTEKPTSAEKVQDASAPTEKPPESPASNNEAAVLIVEDQTLASDFDTIMVKKVVLPASYRATARVLVFEMKDGVLGEEVGALVVAGNNKEDLKLRLKRSILDIESFVAKLVDSKKKPFLDQTGQAVEAHFRVQGDSAKTLLLLKSQSLPVDNLKAIQVEQVTVPDRYPRGLWLALYSDDNGKIGSLLGRKKYNKGVSKDSSVPLTKELKKSQSLRAVFVTPTSSGGFSARNPRAPSPDVGTEGLEFVVNSVAFEPVLEVEDQTLTKSVVSIKKVTIPPATFYAWVVIFSDKQGKPDAMIGKFQYARGTKENTTIKLTTPQEGKKALHAIIYDGQRLDLAKTPVMKNQAGEEMHVTFQIGAASLNYIKSPPYVTVNPRYVIVRRAYSHKKHAWLVLARDNNGKPGTILAKRRVPPRYAGFVAFTHQTNHFETKGTTAEYLQGNGYRRAVRGEENLHVLMYADEPQDGKFTYTPNGTEDQPILDAEGKHVTSRIKVTVKGSVDNSQKDSITYYLQCPHLSQHRNNPTKLHTDCRCHRNLLSLDFPQCVSSIANFLKLSFGKGPRAEGLSFAGFYSGFAEKSSKELITVVSHKDFKTKWPENSLAISVGAVMGVHTETGDRRLIGGRYYSASKGFYDIGKGPVLSYPFDIKKGPDGNYYIASYSYVRIRATLHPSVDVIRMDPKTGDRAYVWRSNHLGQNLDNKPNPYGHCSHGRHSKYGYASVQIGRKGFGMDPKGNFYFSYAHNGNTPESDGIGVLKVTFDGKKCSFVTRSKTGASNVLYKGKDIGSGPSPQAGPYNGLLYHDGSIYGQIVVGNELYKIDVATGNRQVVYKHSNAGPSGSTGAKMAWDSYRNLVWVQGLVDSTMLYDPATNKPEKLWCSSFYRNYKGINCQHVGAWGTNGFPVERGFWFHPTDKEFAYVSNNTKILKVHLPSGTSVIHSY